MLTCTQSSRVAPEVNLRNPLYAGNEDTSEQSTLTLKPRVDIQNRGISGPTKGTYVPQKFKKKGVN